MRNRSVPNYELYGELLSGVRHDPVHLEAIKERSSRHNWTIRLHRHSRLAQIFVFQSAGIFVRLGEIEYTTTEPAILMIPPGIPHGFRFSEDVIGDVITLRTEELDAATNAKIEQFNLDRAYIMGRGAGRGIDSSATPYFDSVTSLIDQLRMLLQDVTVDRSDLLLSVVQLIIAYLSASRHQTMVRRDVPLSNQLSRHEIQADQFCKLVEEHFETSWGVTDYAREVGISAPQLTRISRRILGCPPNELVGQRRILEAKRLLEYTRLSISEIAHRSGYRDAAFFSRAFKQKTGFSPQAYRSEREN